MRTATILLCALPLLAAPLAAQPSSGTHVSATVGVSSDRGGEFVDSDGYTAQLSMSRGISATGPVSWRIGAGGGGVFRNGHDAICRFTSTGGCAPAPPTIFFATPLVGAEIGGPAATLSLHAGPTLYGGSTLHVRASGVGAEGRLDAAVRLVGRVGLLASGRLLALPKVNDAAMTVRSVSVGVRFY